MPSRRTARSKRRNKKCKRSLVARIPTPFETLPEVSRNVLEKHMNELFSKGFISTILSGRPGLRSRILTIEVVMISLLNFVVANMESFLELVDRLQKGKIPGLKAVEVSPQAFYKRLGAIPHTVFLDLLRKTTQTLNISSSHERKWIKKLAPFATNIYAMDDTTLDALARKSILLKQHSKGAMETLGGRLGCVLDIVTGRFAEIIYDADSAANEKTHARPLVERLPTGALYIFDLGFFAFPFLDFLTEKGCFFISRLRNKTSFEIIETLAEKTHYRDRLIWLGKYRSDKAAHPVRLVEIKIDGKWWSYITNVLDPGMLNAPNLWTLYGYRWKIEKTFATVKRALNLAFLRVTHQNGILIQIWSTFTVYQVLQDLRLEIATARGWRDDEISWTNLMRRIAWYAEDPDKLPLRKWLVKNASKLNLQKRGQRKRRMTVLPKKVLKDCLPPPSPPDPTLITSRTARQGDQKPAKQRFPLIIGGLS